MAVATDDDWFLGKDAQAITFARMQGFARIDLGPKTFGEMPPVILTPAEVRAMKADPEIWARYQAFMRAVPK